MYSYVGITSDCSEEQPSQNDPGMYVREVGRLILVNAMFPDIDIFTS